LAKQFKNDMTMSKKVDKIIVKMPKKNMNELKNVQRNYLRKTWACRLCV
jgi:hypothetical protein